MDSFTYEQLIALGGIMLSVLTVLLTFRRDTVAGKEREHARSAEQQLVKDQLSTIADMARETRDTVREMSKQLSDHSREIARIEQRLDDHARRLSAAEDKLDLLPRWHTAKVQDKKEGKSC